MKTIVHEPSASNLYYLTRSLRLLAQRDARVASRVVVFPLGVGDVAARLRAFAQRGNLGNTVVGVADACKGLVHGCVAKRMVELAPVRRGRADRSTAQPSCTRGERVPTQIAFREVPQPRPHVRCMCCRWTTQMRCK